MGGIAVVDLETTGLYYRTDRIVEIGIVALNPELEEEFRWTTLVDPERAVTAERIHGICATDVRAAPTLDDIADDVIGMLMGRVLVAHNAVFDVNHLMLGLQRTGRDVPGVIPAVIDTMRLSSRVVGTRTLAQTCDVLSIDLVDAHAALADAIATSEALRRLVELDSSQVPASTRSHWLSAETGHWRSSPGVLDDSRADPLSSLFQIGATWSWPDQPSPPLAPPAGYTRETAAAHGRRRDGYLMSLVARLPVVDDDPDSDIAPYLTRLDEALEDRLVTSDEAEALVLAADALGLSQTEVDKAHRQYMRALASAAWADGVITAQERLDLARVATMLGLDEAAVARALDSSQSRAERRVASAERIGVAPGDRVVFTGAMSRPRCDLEGQAIGVGLVPTSGISRKTSLLVIADPHSPSRKACRARDLGVRLISEPVFNEVCLAMAA